MKNKNVRKSVWGKVSTLPLILSVLVLCISLTSCVYVESSTDESSEISNYYKPKDLLKKMEKKYGGTFTILKNQSMNNSHIRGTILEVSWSLLPGKTIRVGDYWMKNEDGGWNHESPYTDLECVKYEDLLKEDLEKKCTEMFSALSDYRVIGKINIETRRLSDEHICDSYEDYKNYVKDSKDTVYLLIKQDSTNQEKVNEEKRILNSIAFDMTSSEYNYTRSEENFFCIIYILPSSDFTMGLTQIEENEVTSGAFFFNNSEKVTVLEF